MNFNEKLMNLRKSNGLSQEELGFKLDVTRQTVSKWETGQTTPEMDKLIELSKVFGISIDELVGNESASGEGEDAAERPLVISLRSFRYEYKSKRTLFGLPLIHVNIGFGAKKAKGIIAVGAIARGVISVGALSAGVISLGALSFGVLSLGALAAGLLAAGAISVGAIAVGGISIGLLSLGGLALGKYAIGGFANASDIAMGGFARGHIAIGDSAQGKYVWDNINELTKTDYAAIKETILGEFPDIWRWVLGLFV
ncbi:MAG: helix-turn-helix domain-containing protein [Oscillospiraceae bacterium]|jgi:transcriptional regulator with XRE-family HTH domain|nr:helix-turn-helix domain-containing protein [Oscillospiraceae bacterium]